MDRDSIEIDVQTLARLREASGPLTVLDVRESWEVSHCALEDSLHIPMGEVPSRIGELPAEGALVVMCHHGMRSMQVTQFLHHMGYENARNLAGGIDAWAAEVDPAMPRY
ncbi:rhodanese-like domain-containing protein [Thiohalorhabdus sp. Cl-TMA]|uniref:Rhodanese-like domain-containing protein n=1 Tax=Thiohalorhabdus methylotrophus TaxID=3242694 RepID=A0ABV4TXY2_9GAMM